MNIDFKDFIGVFSDVYPEGFCEHLISEFDRNKDLGCGTDRQNGEGALKTAKDDYQIFSNGKNINFIGFDGANTVDVFFDGLQKCKARRAASLVRAAKHRSVAMAVSGAMENPSISTGVMSAPPPTPVKPTSVPVRAPTSTSAKDSMASPQGVCCEFVASYIISFLFEEKSPFE